MGYTVPRNINPTVEATNEVTNIAAIYLLSQDMGWAPWHKGIGWTPWLYFFAFLAFLGHGRGCRGQNRNQRDKLHLKKKKTFRDIFFFGRKTNTFLKSNNSFFYVFDPKRLNLDPK